MQKYNELSFIPRLGLTNLKQISGGYSCVCPRCGVGTNKRKLYILTENKSFIGIYCQKGCYNTNLKTFMREFNPFLFEEYVKEERLELLEDLKNGTLFQKEKKKSDINSVIDLKYKFELNPKYFKPAYEFREAIDFCKKRNILEHIDKFYYNIHPKHILSNMIIFPFLLEDQRTCYAIQGRRIDGIKRFNTFSNNESMKVYNLFNVKLDEPVYIFESIIDSLMVENSIAMLGTSLSKSCSNMIKEKIFIFDKDIVGKTRTLQMLESGVRCFIYPEYFKYKDFNEAICSGNYKKEQLPKFIKENTYQGLEGILKIKFQLMGKK